MFPYTVAIVLLARIVLALIKNDSRAGKRKSTNEYVRLKNDNNTKIRRRYAMKWFNKRKILNTGPLFNGHVIDIRAFYMLEFDKVPCVNFIGDIDVTNAYKHIRERYSAMIINIYQHCYYDYNEQKSFFNNTIFLMKDERMIELGPNYCHLLHNANDYAWADTLIRELCLFRVIKESPASVQVIGFARPPVMN